MGIIQMWSDSLSNEMLHKINENITSASQNPSGRFDEFLLCSIHIFLRNSEHYHFHTVLQLPILALKYIFDGLIETFCHQDHSVFGTFYRDISLEESNRRNVLCM